jgi:hypothetical protein
MSKPRHCEVCKQPIDPERVDGYPETRLCTRHGEAIKQYGGEFIVTASQERTSKSGSLKINYGGIETQSVRNYEGIARLKDDYADSQL